MALIWFNVIFILVVLVLLGKILMDNQQSRTSSSNTHQMVRTIDPRVIHEMIQKDERSFMLIDVRSNKEFQRSRIKGAININVMDLNFMKMLKKLDKQEQYVVYGQRDTRSQRAFDIMKKNGFKEVYVLSGGFLEWQMFDFPVVK